jgi:hypothetical protein
MKIGVSPFPSIFLFLAFRRKLLLNDGAKSAVANHFVFVASFTSLVDDFGFAGLVHLETRRTHGDAGATTLTFFGVDDNHRI